MWSLPISDYFNTPSVYFPSIFLLFSLFFPPTFPSSFLLHLFDYYYGCQANRIRWICRRKPCGRKKHFSNIIQNFNCSCSSFTSALECLFSETKRFMNSYLCSYLYYRTFFHFEINCGAELPHTILEFLLDIQMKIQKKSTDFCFIMPILIKINKINNSTSFSCLPVQFLSCWFFDSWNH